jgi:hypothetical protein
LFVDTRGSHLASERQLVALLGLDHDVVTTADAVLVARREPGDGLMGLPALQRRGSTTLPALRRMQQLPARALRCRQRIR